MKTRIGLVLVLISLVLVPAYASAGRIGLGYSGYPMGGVLGGSGDLATIRYSTHSYFFEGGFRMFDAVDTELSFGTKGAIIPAEFHGIPLELGASFGLVTGARGDDALTHLGFFAGLSTLVTDEVGVGVAVYPLSFGFGGGTTTTDILTPTFNIHFMF